MTGRTATFVKLWYLPDAQSGYSVISLYTPVNTDDMFEIKISVSPHKILSRVLTWLVYSVHHCYNSWILFYMYIFQCFTCAPWCFPSEHFSRALPSSPMPHQLLLASYLCSMMFSLWAFFHSSAKFSDASPVISMAIIRNLSFSTELL